MATERTGGEGADESGIIARDYLVPVRDALDRPMDVPPERIADGTVPVVSLDAIPAGMLANTVGGLKAGDPGYVPVRESILRVVPGTGSAGSRKAAETWIRSLAVHADGLALASVAVTGDICMARGVAERLAGDGPKSVFGNTLPYLRGADLTLGNLESAATTRGTRSGKTFAFRFDPAALAILGDSGFDCFMLSNNHVFDYGQTGFLDTMEACSKAGIAIAGAGMDESAALSPWTTGLPGGVEARVWAAGFYPVERTGFDGRAYRAKADRPGIAWLDDAFIARFREISGAARGGEGAESGGYLDIVMVHGGVEGTDTPTEAQKAAYRALVDAGADAVFGSHPHVLQGFEMYKGKPVFYSLGDFIFPGMEDVPGGEDAVIAIARFLGERLVYLDTVPTRIRKTAVAKGPDAILARFHGLSKNLR